MSRSSEVLYTNYTNICQNHVLVCTPFLILNMHKACLFVHAAFIVCTHIILFVQTSMISVCTSAYYMYRRPLATDVLVVEQPANQPTTLYNLLTCWRIWRRVNGRIVKEIKESIKVHVLRSKTLSIWTDELISYDLLTYYVVRNEIISPSSIILYTTI